MVGSARGGVDVDLAPDATPGGLFTSPGRRACIHLRGRTAHPASPGDRTQSPASSDVAARISDARVENGQPLRHPPRPCDNVTAAATRRRDLATSSPRRRRHVTAAASRPRDIVTAAASQHRHCGGVATYPLACPHGAVAATVQSKLFDAGLPRPTPARSGGRGRHRSRCNRRHPPPCRSRRSRGSPSWSSCESTVGNGSSVGGDAGTRTAASGSSRDPLPSGRRLPGGEDVRGWACESRRIFRGYSTSRSRSRVSPLCRG